MFVAFPHHPETDAPLHPAAIWIDLLEPTDAEARQVAQATGLHVPTLAELSEIETSSRLQRRNGALYLSMPAILRGEAQEAHVTPVGFVLSRERLITVRFAMLPVFDHYADACRADPHEAPGSLDVFLGLLEGVVDRLADVLEREGEELDALSRRIFHPARAKRTRPARLDRELRAALRQVGGTGDLIGKLRDTLLGVGRIGQYTMLHAAEWFERDHRLRFETLRADIASLNDYDAHLANKVQFLLDATLGLIGVEQANIVKVLTVVSIVGIPPTFIASMYGMNFKIIPELQWEYGYYYALTLMLLSAVLPIVWFKIKGWL